MDQRLTRNAVICLRCKTEVESTHRHDFRECPCGDVAVDGGLEYQRRAIKTGAKFIDVSEFEDLPADKCTGRNVCLFEGYICRVHDCTGYSCHCPAEVAEF